MNRVLKVSKQLRLSSQGPYRGWISSNGGWIPVFAGVTDGVPGRVWPIQGTRIEPRVHVLKGRPSWVRGENGPGDGFRMGSGGQLLACGWWGGGRICFCSAIGRRAVMAVSSVINVQANPKIQEFGPGDSVKVNYRVREGERERIQAFQGVVIKRRGEGPGANFTVRRVTQNIGVERTFPFYSPRNRVGGSGATRESPSRSALLPAGSLRTGGAHQGAGPLLNLDGVGGSRTAPTGDGQRNGIRAPTRSLFQK